MFRVVVLLHDPSRYLVWSWGLREGLDTEEDPTNEGMCVCVCVCVCVDIHLHQRVQS